MRIPCGFRCIYRGNRDHSEREDGHPFRTFLTKVFEGPFSNMRKWIEEMKTHVSTQGKSFRKLYFYYTTCPKCAKKYGKNYVVILAQV